MLSFTKTRRALWCLVKVGDTGEGLIRQGYTSVSAEIGHAGNLALISGPSGLRPDLDVQEGQPIAGALACMVAYDGLARIGPGAKPMVILPSPVGGVA